LAADPVEAGPSSERVAGPTSEETRYDCHNRRGDVSVIVDGIPTDSPNLARSPDNGDVDLDRDRDAADVTAAGGSGVYATLRGGPLSPPSTGNRRGHAAYEHDMNLDDSLAHVRYRVLRLDFGRWLTRDPIGYREGQSLYAYVAGRPVLRTDRSGL